MENKSGKSSGFVFQTIPMDDALRMVRAGGGVYSELKDMLLEKLPQLNGEAFVFGLPNGKEVPEKDRKPISMTINKCLRQAGLFWKLTYHEKRKLFVCVPKENLAPRKYKIQKKSSPTGRGGKDDRLGELFTKTLDIFNITPEDFFKKRAGLFVPWRAAFINVAKDSGIGTGKISDFLEIDKSLIYTAVSTREKCAIEINTLKKAMGEKS